MAKASTEGPAFPEGDNPSGLFEKNNSVLDDAYEEEMAGLQDEQMEDIIARGVALGDSIEKSKEETVDLSRPSKERVDQPTVTSTPKKAQEGKKRKMLSRQPVGTSVPATTSENTITPTAAGEADKALDSSHVELSSPKEKFGTPPQSRSWSEEFDLADDAAPYPSDDNKGGLYGTTDPVLSAASSHMADVEGRIEGHMTAVTKALENLRADMTTANTDMLNRIRELERKLPHDSTIGVPASTVPSFRTNTTTSSEPPPTSSRPSLAERIHRKKEQRKV